jgi:KEOPS complex subunit Pcc1
VRHETVLTLDYDSASDAALVERSLEPEIGDIEGDRTTATLARDGDEIRMTIDAADLVALRAGQNTWLSLVGVAERCAAAGADGSKPR